MVSIILINYNAYDMTCRCIESVQAFTKEVEYEIILVDNASKEFDAEQFKARFPKVKLILNSENSGFAKGNNVGIREAKGDLILLLNNDTLLRDNAVKLTADHIHTHPRTGVAGVRLVYPDGRVQYTARRFRNISWELLDLFRFVPFMMPYKMRSRMLLGRYFRHDEPVACDWICGAFFMFRRTILDQLPGNKLNEDFFMYGEDALWCHQIRNLGYTIDFLSLAEVVHLNRASTDPKKQIAVLKTIRDHDLAVFRMRGNPTWKYLVLKLLFGAKEAVRLFARKMAGALGLDLFR